MFIRKTIKTEPKTGKEYVSYQLVESFRTANGPRQRILGTIGAKIALNDAERKELANRIEDIVSGVSSLFNVPQHIEALAQHFAKLVLQSRQSTPSQETVIESKKEPVYHSVDLSSIEHRKARSIGAERVALAAYQKLGFDSLFEELGFSKRQRMVAAGSIIARAVFPTSELATAEWLANASGLDELLGTSFENLDPNPLYRISDVLYAHKAKIELHLSQRAKDLFQLRETVILYDITNTYFEGAVKGHSKAKRGRSKEKRSDSPLISLGVVLDSDGFAKHSEIFEGNLNEPSTLQTMISRLNQQTRHLKPIVVMDSGIATKANIAWLRSEGYRYIVMARQKKRPPRSESSEVMIRDEGDYFITGTLTKDLETGDTLLQCFSNQRHKKEQCIKTSSQKAFEAKLESLKEGLLKVKGTKSYQAILRSIGRLHQKYPRLAKSYTIEVKPSKDGSQAEIIEWAYNETAVERSYSGTYTLTTNIHDLDEKSLWGIYVMLSEAEACYRSLKSEAGLRPNWHKKEGRIDAHIFISMLAYHLISAIRHELRLKGVSYSWDQIRNRMKTQVIITTSLHTESQEIITIRTASEPESFHQQIYNLLNLPGKPTCGYRTSVSTKM